MNIRPRSDSNTGPNRSTVNRSGKNKKPVKVGPFTGFRNRSSSNGNKPSQSNNVTINTSKSPHNNIPNRNGNPNSPIYYTKQTEELLAILSECQELVTQLQQNSKNSSKTLEELKNLENKVVKKVNILIERIKNIKLFFTKQVNKLMKGYSLKTIKDKIEEIKDVYRPVDANIPNINNKNTLKQISKTMFGGKVIKPPPVSKMASVLYYFYIVKFFLDNNKNTKKEQNNIIKIQKGAKNLGQILTNAEKNI
mgnify:FL=1|tara:strand:- start:2212 stop:2964 length:753 start_codon:yes stop_codon:yes gene_type:complete